MGSHRSWRDLYLLQCESKQSNIPGVLTSRASDAMPSGCLRLATNELSVAVFACGGTARGHFAGRQESLNQYAIHECVGMLL